VIVPTLFLYFLLFCYPYILLQFNVFYYLFVIFLSSRHMPKLRFALTQHTIEQDANILVHRNPKREITISRHFFLRRVKNVLEQD